MGDPERLEGLPGLGEGVQRGPVLLGLPVASGRCNQGSGLGPKGKG